MRTSLLLSSLAFFLVFSSCSPECICTDDFNDAVTYSKGDVVSYAGTCWKADAQGKGIIPGPWLENGNDIWKELKGCD